MTDTRRQKLKYRAAHRGFREADLIFGGFAEAYVDDMSEAQLEEFERLMAVPDHDLYAWVVGRAETPDNYKSDVMDLMKGFRFDPSTAQM
ncbi:MAG: succinate dehydrogenase assembly factor 2 [Pseudomonadota bacterium]